MPFTETTRPPYRKRKQATIGRTIAKLPDPTDLVVNILDTYTAATIADPHADSRPNWYALQRDEIERLAFDHGVSIRTAVGIVASLSPGCEWQRNLDLADRMLHSGDCSHPYGDAIRKARAIRDGGDPSDVLRGRKVRSFYRNLLYPNRPGPVTIDRHAFDIALCGPNPEVRKRGKGPSVADRKILDRPGGYQLVAACYRTAARRLGLDPHTLQAITWEHFRTL